MSRERQFEVSAAAARAGVSCQTIRNWIARGLIEAERTPTGRYRIPSSSLQKLLTSAKSQNTQTSQA